MLGAREVEHADPASVRHAQRLPGAVIEQPRAVEASVSGPADDELRPAVELNAEHLVGVARQQVALAVGQRRPAGVKALRELVRRGGGPPEHPYLLALPRARGALACECPARGKLEIGPRQVQLHSPTGGERSGGERLIGAGRAAAPQHPPDARLLRGDLFHEREDLGRRAARADAAVEELDHGGNCAASRLQACDHDREELMPVPELNGRELLSEWRQVMDSVISSAASAAGRSELPSELLRASQRQLELVQEVVDGERRRQGRLIGTLLAPIDAVFDLLEETGSTLRSQAEALEAAGVALQESASLVRVQAELFERVIGTLRQPTDFARSAAGATARTGGTRKRAATRARAEPPARRPRASSPAKRPTPAKPAAKPAKRSTSAAKRSSAATKRKSSR